MKNVKWILPVLAVALILFATVGSAMAYFTAHTESLGGYSIHLGDRTEITEQFSSWTKKVKISNSRDSESVFIRARAFCGSQYTLQYVCEDEWTEGGDGYCYYSAPVPGGGSTNDLLIKISGIPDDPAENASFNVVVVYESTPVLYRADGSPYADWSMQLDRGGTP